MKLTITTLVIVEGSYIQGIFHSLEEHPGKAYQELVDQVENEYGYDADKDHVPLHFKTIQDIKNYFELVHIEAILFGILQLTPEHQDIIVIDLKKHLKSFIQDKDQAEEMITQYTCYYNAIKRWESNHKKTEILHQLEISNLLEQLKNN